MVGGSWINFDPLTTSQMAVRIQEQYEILATDTGHLAQIQLHHGSRLFKCTYLFCANSRRGFETRGERDIHVQNHGTPWKCSLPDCDFSTIGFRSKKKRDEHWLKLHLPTASQLQERGGNFESLDPEEAQPLLFGFIIQEDVPNVQALLSSPGGTKLKAEVIAAARLMAAQQGSLAITQLLAPTNEMYVPDNIVISALASEDVEFTDWALAKAQPDDCAKFINAALGTKSEDVYAVWEKHILNLLEKTRDRLKYLEPPTEDLFKKKLYTEIKGNDLKENRLKHLWRKISRKYMTPEELGDILVRIAKASCSLNLAQEVLHLGAPVDYPTNYKDGITALQAAAKKNTQEAALLMQLLISKGASTIGCDSRGIIIDIGTLQGPKNIAQWLGMPWDELLEQYPNTRSQNPTYLLPSSSILFYNR